MRYCVDIGSMEVIESSLIDVTYDLDGFLRTGDGTPDLGAYEFIPEIN